MKTVIGLIPLLVAEKESHKPTEEHKAITDKLSCQYYGDFIINSNPVTFEDAVRTYGQLPKLLGEEEKNSVPVRVWLTPLKNLDPTAPELKREISVGLVRRAQDAQDNMNEIEMRCNESMEENVAKSLQPVYKKLHNFQNRCQDYMTTLKQSMKERCLSIRAGREDEAAMEKLFHAKEKSPFSHENLKKWLDNQEREINIIRSCMELMEGIKTVRKRSELEKEILASGVEDVLCFVFTSLEMSDPYLEHMTSYLPSNVFAPPPTQDWWFSSKEVVTEMRRKAKDFQDLAKGLKSSKKFRFLIAALPNENFKGATIHHYKDGNLVTENFSKPSVPQVDAIKDRRHLIWCKFTCSHDKSHVSDVPGLM